jgi:tetratricopeptide (TPR) repeat protein
MKKTFLYYLSRLFFFLVGVCLVILLSLFFQSGNEKLKEANEKYIEGEKAQTIASRQQAFNHALTIYTELESQYHPKFGNGKLYYDIANTYFQLGEYPWAVLYYYRAMALMPREERVQRNLLLAKDKLGVTETFTPSVFRKIFFFHEYLSLPERLQLFFVLSLIAFVFCSCYMWFKTNWLKYVVAISTILAIVFLLSIGYTRYFSPLEGVLIHSADLYRDAGFQYAKVTDQPIFSGTKLRVLSVSPDGKWLKVLTPGAQVGFVSNDAIRLI